MHDQSLPSRRFTTRVPSPEGVWVLWSCGGCEDVSRVRDISTSGVFLETDARRGVGSKISLHFLVPEGQIRAEGCVRHVDGEHGVGVRFTAVKAEDRPNLATLVSRCRGSSAAHVAA